MGRIPEDTIQTVRDRVDIVDLVGRFVSLRSAGRNHKGLCPFHDEKTPSFVVTPDRGTFKCFGCGEGGNAFGFLMRLENLSFPEAVRALAAELGVPARFFDAATLEAEAPRLATPSRRPAPRPKSWTSSSWER